MISGAKKFAKANSAPGGVIAVVDDGGNLVALERLDGTFTAGGKHLGRQGQDSGNVQTTNEGVRGHH